MQPALFTAIMRVSKACGGGSRREAIARQRSIAMTRQR
ncbi:hypothetical protein FHR67_003006 [Xanthomonas arboricola]|nr:hypothetical protein [Xanthomonas campestris]